MIKRISNKIGNIRCCIYTIVVILAILCFDQKTFVLAQDNSQFNDLIDSSFIDPFSIKVQAPELFDVFMQRLNEIKLAKEAEIKKALPKVVVPPVIKAAPLPPPVKEQIILPGMVVTGILYDGDSSIAFINGQVLQEGDEVSGAKILKIKKGGIDLLFKKKNFSIPFNNE